MSAFGRDYEQPYDPDDIDDPRVQREGLLARRSKDGATFILDAPTHVPAIWGSGQDVLWAKGESLIIVGPPGVGKTTLASQVIRARLGLADKVLDQPVEPTDKRVLYLAMDRPAQIARALRRGFSEYDRDILAERFIAWVGPPPSDLAKHPEELIGLATTFEADTIIVDSLKDAAIGLTDDEVAAGWNRARQYCLAEGVEVLELHHQVKRGVGGTKPNTLADVYGSAWITAGAGSVVLLYGEAGDPIVDFRHLKQPAQEIGPHRVIHDHLNGISEIYHPADIIQMATAAGIAGLTARTSAGAMFSTDKPTDSQVEKARRKLDQLVRDGHLVKVEANINGKAGHIYHRAAVGSVEMSTPRATPSDPTHPTFRAQQPLHAVVESDTTPRTPRPLHVSDKPAGQDPTLHPTHPTERAPHDPPPPFTGGRRGATQPDACPECNYRGDHATYCPSNPIQPDDGEEPT